MPPSLRRGKIFALRSIISIKEYLDQRPIGIETFLVQIAELYPAIPVDLLDLEKSYIDRFQGSRKTAKMKHSAELKPSYWSHVASIVATFAIGFIWGGWVNGRTAAARGVDDGGSPAIVVRPSASKKQKRG
jgi:hypothetical protein